jgi:hypothetical protein
MVNEGERRRRRHVRKPPRPPDDLVTFTDVAPAGYGADATLMENSGRIAAGASLTSVRLLREAKGGT